MWKMSTCAGIRTHDLWNESPPVTTRPWLPPNIFIFMVLFCVGVVKKQKAQDISSLGQKHKRQKKLSRI